MADRGVSPVIGMMLVAGIVVLLLGTLQVGAVPNWNEDVEFTHLQASEGAFKTLYDTLQDVTADGNERSVTISLAPSYPQRFILRNPPDPSGTLATADEGTITIANATVRGEAGDYWDGGSKSYTSRAITFAPDYRYVDNFQRLVLDNSAVASQYNETAVTQTGQNLVDGRRITLITVNGSLERTGTDTASVELKPVSAPARAITVTNGSGPVTVTVPTLLGNDTWTGLLAEEYVTNGGHIANQSFQAGEPYNQLTLTMEAGVTYELRLAKLGVGTAIDTTENATYLTRIRGSDQTVFVGGTAPLTVEVRDRFNTPMSGVDVEFTTLSGRGDFQNGENATTITTDQDGRATAEFVPRSPDEMVIQASIDEGDAPPERVNFTLQVEVPPSTGGQSAGIILVEADLGSGGSKHQVDMVFENLRNSPKNVTDVGMTVFYDENRGEGTAEVKNATINGDFTVEIGGQFTDISGDPLTLNGPSGTETTVTTRFSNVDGNDFDVDEGDFYQVTFIYSDGTVTTYLVVPR